MSIFVGKDIALAQDCGSSKNNIIINSDNHSNSTDEYVVCLGDTAPTVQQLTCSDVEPDDEPDQQLLPLEIGAREGTGGANLGTSDDITSVDQSAGDPTGCLKPVPPAIESSSVQCDEHSLKNESAAVPIVRFYGRQHKRPVRYR